MRDQLEEWECQSVLSMNGSFIQELLIHSGQMRPGIVLHQEETRAHCTSSHGTVYDNMEVCATFQVYASSDLHWPTAKPVMLYDVTGSIMFTTASSESFTAATCAHISVNLLWYIERILVPILVFSRELLSCMVLWHRALMPPWWSMFLAVWSETCSGLLGVIL